MYVRMRNQQARCASNSAFFQLSDAAASLISTPTPMDELSDVLKTTSGLSLMEIADAMVDAIANLRTCRVTQSRYRERIALCEMVDVMVKNAKETELEIPDSKRGNDLQQDVKIVLAKHMAEKLPTKQSIVALVDALSGHRSWHLSKERPFENLIRLQKSFEIGRKAMDTKTIEGRHFWEALRPMVSQNLSVNIKDDLIASLRDWMRKSYQVPSKSDLNSFAEHSPYILNQLVKNGDIDLAAPSTVRTKHTIDPIVRWENFAPWAKPFGYQVNMIDALDRDFNDEHEQRAAQELLAKIKPTSSIKSKSGIN